MENGMRNALIGKLNELTLDDSPEMGKLAEMVIYNHLGRLKFNLEKTPNPRVDFWKNKYEVDFVLEIGATPIPVESKYKNNPLDKEKKGLYDFLSQTKSPFGIMIVKDKLELKENVLTVPLWLFLLMC